MDASDPAVGGGERADGIDHDETSHISSLVRRPGATCSAYGAAMADARYDAVADTYASGDDDYSNNATAALVELLGDVDGQRVLDLACGHGLMARHAARRGASVTGIDISRRLLDRARATEAADPLGVHYILGDVTADHVLSGTTFDAVVSNFGLSDIDDLSAACRTIARVLARGGIFVAALLHPCFPGVEGVSSSWLADGTYYDEGWWRPDAARSPLRAAVGANHRTISTYLNTLHDHSLPVESLSEPRPNAAWAEARPGSAELPLYLVLRSRRVAEQRG
jgi:SAM-dependent methyltransferase